MVKETAARKPGPALKQVSLTREIELAFMKYGNPADRNQAREEILRGRARKTSPPTARCPLHLSTGLPVLRPRRDGSSKTPLLEGKCPRECVWGRKRVGTWAEKMAPTGRQERKEDHVCLDRKCEALVLAFQLAGPPRASSFPRSPVPRHRRENTNAQSSWGSYALTSHSQHHCALPCPPQTPRPWASSRGQP